MTTTPAPAVPAATCVHPPAAALPDGTAALPVPSSDRSAGGIEHPDGEAGRQIARPVLDLLLRAAEARHQRGGHPAPGCRPPGGTLFVVRVRPGATAEEDGDRVTRQLALAAQGLPVAGRLLEDAGAPVRWPEAFGAVRVPVPGSGEAVLWSPPDAPDVLVLAGACSGDAGWAGTVTSVVRAHAPDRVAVPALHALGRDAADVAAVLRPVRELLVRGQTMHPAVHGPFLDLLQQQERQAPQGRRSGPRRRGYTAAASRAYA